MHPTGSVTAATVSSGEGGGSRSSKGWSGMEVGLCVGLLHMPHKTHPVKPSLNPTIIKLIMNYREPHPFKQNSIPSTWKKLNWAWWRFRET